MGAINAVYLVGCSSAMLLGGFVAARDLRLLYVCSIGVDLLAILLLPLHERPRTGRVATSRIDLGRDLRELTLRNPSLAGLMLLQAAAGTLVTSFGFYGQGYMREALIPLTVIGAAGMLGNLAAIAPTRLAYRLERRFGDRTRSTWAASSSRSASWWQVWHRPARASSGAASWSRSSSRCTSSPRGSTPSSAAP